MMDNLYCDFCGYDAVWMIPQGTNVEANPKFCEDCHKRLVDKGIWLERIRKISPKDLAVHWMQQRDAEWKKHTSDCNTGFWVGVFIGSVLAAFVALFIIAMRL